MTPKQYDQRIDTLQSELLYDLNLILSDRLQGTSEDDPLQVDVETRERAADVDGYVSIIGLYKDPQTGAILTVTHGDGNAQVRALKRFGQEPGEENDELDDLEEPRSLSSFDLLTLHDLYTQLHQHCA